MIQAKSSTEDEDDSTCLIEYSDGLAVDDALALSGPYGKFQILVQIFFMYSVFTIAYQGVISYFVGDSPSWTCTSNTSSVFCKEYFGVDIPITSINFSARCIMKREEWRYVTPKTYSYVTEFDLVCTRNSIAAIVGGIIYIGAALGALVSGILTDLYGRKLMFMTSLFVTAVSSIGCSFIHNVWQLMLLRGLLGAAQGTGLDIGFIYLGEFIPNTHRSLSSNIFQICYPLSAILLVSCGYYVRNWRNLQLYISFPAITAVVLLIIIPPSPRWLLANGKVSKAENVIRTIIRWNGKPCMNLKLMQIRNNPNTEVKKHTYIDLFRKCETVLLVIAQSVLWFTSDLLFFGVTLAASNLGGNMYESFLLILIPDIPCCLLAIYLCDRYGRKKTVLSSCFLAGTFIGLIAIFVKNSVYGYSISLVLAMIGKCFLNFLSNGLYIFKFELFPTVVRSQGFCICSIASCIGGVCAPFLTDVLQDVDMIVPYLVMAVVGLLSALVGLILPETHNRPSRELFEDIFISKEVEVAQGNSESNKMTKDIE